MKKKRILAVFISLLLCLVTASPAFAQTITVDEGKDGVYSGDILMTQNTRYDFDVLKYYDPNHPGDLDTNKDFYESWEVTGIPGATGNDGQVIPANTAETAGEEVTQAKALAENSEDTARASLEAQTQAATVPYKVGDTRTFTSSIHVTGPSFAAKCIAVGDHTTFWLDTENKDGFATEDIILGLKDKIDTEIYRQLTSSFGGSDSIDVDGDGKVAFVFYPMPDPHLGGLFAPSDLRDNQMDMLNINSAATMDDETYGENLGMGILTHEWQHLINYAQTGGGEVFTPEEEKESYIYSETWLNETFAQNAVAVCGVSGDVPNVQLTAYNTYVDAYNTTVPMVFSGLYVPQGRVDTAGTGAYINWYLFGRYLASQTEGLKGGGDEIYKTILNTNRETRKSPVSDEQISLGTCDKEAVTDALTKMGYMGEGNQVKDFDALIRNYTLANFFQQKDGIYSFGDNLGNFSLSQAARPTITSAVDAPQKLIGAGTATFTKIENGSITVDEAAAGEHIRHLGITINYDGVTAEGYSPVDGAMTVDKGTPVALSTTDTDVTLRYTTDGSDPAAETGTVYEGPVTVDQDMTIKAIVTDAYGTSDVAAFNYKVKTEAPADTGEGTTTDKNADGANPTGSGKNAGTGIAGTQTQTILAAAALLLLATGGCILIRKRVKK